MPGSLSLACPFFSCKPPPPLKCDLKKISIWIIRLSVLLRKGTQISDLTISGFWLMEMLPQCYLNSHPMSENPFVSCAIWLGYLNPHWDTCDTCVHFSSSGHSIVPYYTLPPPCTLFLMTTQRSSWSSIYGMSPAGPATEPWFQKQASWGSFLQAGLLLFNARMGLIINWGPLILTGLRMNQGSIYPCFPTNKPRPLRLFAYQWFDCNAT